MKLISWNVNGLRAALRAGLAEFVAREQPDALCLQEIKANPEDVDASVFDGYHVTWNPAHKKGYSGVLIATREKPTRVTHGLGLPHHDTEGRLLVAEFPDFQVVTVYTPNSQRGLTRLEYRLDWDTAFRTWLRKLDRKKPLVLCGDFNCAHEEIDLANPRENRRNAGFTDEERGSFSSLLDTGFIDSFRSLHPAQPGHYSWWTYRSDARARNIGWRLDYWLVSKKLWPRVRQAQILSHIQGSDHCPVLLELDAEPTAG
jgi:exodeoxyribonuclease-3